MGSRKVNIYIFNHCRRPRPVLETPTDESSGLLVFILECNRSNLESFRVAAIADRHRPRRSQRSWFFPGEERNVARHLVI